jgi:hypothetical protein
MFSYTIDSLKTNNHNYFFLWISTAIFMIIESGTLRTTKMEWGVPIDRSLTEPDGFVPQNFMHHQQGLPPHSIPRALYSPYSFAYALLSNLPISPFFLPSTLTLLSVHLRPSLRGGGRVIMQTPASAHPPPKSPSSLWTKTGRIPGLSSTNPVPSPSSRPCHLPHFPAI